ncbi:hypothetical protein BS50DRAFT_626862 [Corynespora cassiicola Philippines]|uniref:Uncharacterized protein n=1 Tax=Corynespora cassiicola Philippines TaxID=1448308 RepID=A0A2T2N168_CORCC|nr:hypothetical protein BS50DRAFT_626862 [Corynespora cassiicola Philippines]
MGTMQDSFVNDPPVNSGAPSMPKSASEYRLGFGGQGDTAVASYRRSSADYGLTNSNVHMQESGPLHSRRDSMQNTSIQYEGNDTLQNTPTYEQADVQGESDVALYSLRERCMGLEGENMALNQALGFMQQELIQQEVLRMESTAELEDFVAHLDRTNAKLKEEIIKQKAELSRL